MHYVTQCIFSDYSVLALTTNFYGFNVNAEKQVASLVSGLVRHRLEAVCIKDRSN